MTSAGHRGAPKPDGVNWDDINMHSTGGIKGGILKYGQSKAMDVMLAHELGRRYGSQGLVSLSLHPGSLKTGLQRHMPRFFRAITKPLLYEQHFGGLTELFAGFNDEIENTKMIGNGGRNGSYIEPWGRWGSGGKDVFEGLQSRKTGERLWEMCEEVLKEWM